MPTQGTWNIAGINLPDWGITEAITGGNWGGTTLNNPAIPSVPGIYNNPSTPTSTQMSSPIPSGAGAYSTPSPVVNNPNPVQQQQQSTASYQQQWEQAGHAGTAPVGYHGESGAPGIDEAAINAVYNPTMGYLNQAEGQLRADFPNVLDSAQKAYETAIAELTAGKTKNLGTIAENTVTAGQRKEDALSAARRMYDELRRGYAQRFGGGSSAGQAAFELSGAEQQRQMGATTRDYSTTMRQIDQSKVQLDQDYQAGSLKILQSKTDAIAQANRDFQNQLLTIAGQRAQTESAKAAAKLDALNTLRNQAFAAQQQALQLQQNWDQTYKASQLDLQNYAAKLNMAGQGSASAIASYLPTTQPTAYNVGGGGTQSGTPYVGQINNSGKKWNGMSWV